MPSLKLPRGMTQKSPVVRTGGGVAVGGYTQDGIGSVRTRKNLPPVEFGPGGWMRAPHPGLKKLREAAAARKANAKA